SSGPALQLEQGRMSPSLRFDQATLQAPQPVTNPALRLYGAGCRNGVDEQPENLFRIRQFSRSSRNGNAETRLRLPRVEMKQQRPGALEKRAERQILRAGEILKVPGRARVQPELMFDTLRIAGAGAGDMRRKQRRLLQPLQLRLPEVPGGVAGLA